MTHGITYLPKVDKIIVMKNGQITEQGTYAELVENKGEFNEFLLQYLSEKGEEEFDDDLDGESFYCTSQYSVVIIWKAVWIYNFSCLFEGGYMEAATVYNLHVSMFAMLNCFNFSPNVRL